MHQLLFGMPPEWANDLFITGMCCAGLFWLALHATDRKVYQTLWFCWCADCMTVDFFSDWIFYGDRDLVILAIAITDLLIAIYINRPPRKRKKIRKVLGEKAKAALERIKKTFEPKPKFRPGWAGVAR